MSEKLVDIHVKIPAPDIERLQKFCLHRGDMTFLIWQSIRAYVKKLEDQAEKEDARLIHEVEV